MNINNSVTFAGVALCACAKKAIHGTNVSLCHERKKELNNNKKIQNGEYSADDTQQAMGQIQDAQTKQHIN